MFSKGPDKAANRRLAEKIFCSVWFFKLSPIKPFDCEYNAEPLRAITTVKRLLSYLMGCLFSLTGSRYQRAILRFSPRRLTLPIRSAPVPLEGGT